MKHRLNKYTVLSLDLGKEIKLLRRELVFFAPYAMVGTEVFYRLVLINADMQDVRGAVLSNVIVIYGST